MIRNGGPFFYDLIMRQRIEFRMWSVWMISFSRPFPVYFVSLLKIFWWWRLDLFLRNLWDFRKRLNPYLVWVIREEFLCYLKILNIFLYILTNLLLILLTLLLISHLILLVLILATALTVDNLELNIFL